MERVKREILREVAASPKNFWFLLDRCNFSLRDFIAALKELQESGLIIMKDGLFHITEKGEELVNPRSLNFEVSLCPSCYGKRVIPKAMFVDILDKFRCIVKDRPYPKLDFFQGYMVEQDVIARVALMHYYGDLDGKSILIIGDDDLLSIALALTELPSRIVVLDVDSRLGDLINSVNREHNFNIEFLQYNVADPLPVDLRGKFDVFSSEPLETMSGLKAFILRGVSGLRENGVGYFGLTRYEASLKKWLSIQRFLVGMNCVITDLINGFSSYPMSYGDVDYDAFAYKLGFEVAKNPGINWYKSALFRFEVLGKVKPLEGFNRRIHVKSIDPMEDLTHPKLGIMDGK